MPFTPFHLGPALLIGLFGRRWVDFPTVLIASVIVDLRAVLVFFDLLDGPLHGSLHTFAGATALAAIVIGVGTQLRPVAESVLSRLVIHQPVSTKRIVVGGVAGTWSHILLDSVLYADMAPLAPVPGNPLLGTVNTSTLYLSCVVAGVLGVGGYAVMAVGWIET